jgi:hypothetical protein
MISSNKTSPFSELEAQEPYDAIASEELRVHLTRVLKKFSGVCDSVAGQSARGLRLGLGNKNHCVENAPIAVELAWGFPELIRGMPLENKRERV